MEALKSFFSYLINPLPVNQQPIVVGSLLTSEFISKEETHFLPEIKFYPEWWLCNKGEEEEEEE